MKQFKQGDRVYCYDFGTKIILGNIFKNVKYPEVSEWFIEYDDGEACAVLDIEKVYHAILPLAIDLQITKKLTLSKGDEVEVIKIISEQPLIYAAKAKGVTFPVSADKLCRI